MFEQKCPCGRLLYQVDDASTLAPTIECRHCHRVLKVRHNLTNKAAANARRRANNAKKKAKEAAAAATAE